MFLSLEDVFVFLIFEKYLQNKVRAFFLQIVAILFFLSLSYF